MAKITQDLQTGNPTNYLGYSQGYSKSDVMGTADNSLGDLFNNLGKLGGEAVKGTNDVIQNNIRLDWMAAAKPVIDQAGGNTPPDQVPAIAGTGARGARYTAAGGQMGAGSQSGTEGSDVLAMDAAVPPGLANDVSGLNKLKSAYDAGHLSQSYFDSNVESIVSRLKSKYAGYEDYVDSVASSMTGVQSANNLRKSLLNDIVSMQAANSSAMNRLQTRFHADAKYMDTVAPGLTFEQYSKNPSAYDTKVNELKSRDYSIESKKNDLELQVKQGAVNADQAVGTFTSAAQEQVGRFFGASLAKLNTTAANLKAAGANADPKALAAFQAQAQQVEQQMRQSLTTLASSQLSEGSANTFASIIKDKAKLDGAIETAMLPLTVSKEGVAAKDFTVAGAAGLMGKMRTSMDTNNLMDSNKSARALGAMREGIGDQTTATVIQLSGGAGLKDLTQAYTTGEFLNTKKTGDQAPTPVSKVIEGGVRANNGQQPGKVAATVLQQHLLGLQDKDPESAVRFAQALYNDPSLFSQMSLTDQRKAYGLMTSPQVTDRMIQLQKSNPEVFDSYSNFVRQNAIPLYKDSMSQLQGAAEFNRYDVQYNPKELSFSATSKPEYADRYTKAGFPDPAQAQVNGINQLGRTLRPVLEAKYGKDGAGPEFLKILMAAGYNPDAKQKGTWYDGLGGRVVDAYAGALDAEGSYNAELVDTARKSIDQLKATLGVKTGKDVRAGITLDENAQGGIPDNVAGRWRYAYDRFTQRGWSPEQSAGIIGSLAGETSTLNPNQSHDGGIGLGIAGWNKERLTALKAFAKDSGDDFRDVDTQLSFVDHELRTTEKAAGDRIKMAKSPEEAAAIFTHLYERPSQPHTQVRMNNATSFYKRFASAQ